MQATMPYDQMKRLMFEAIMKGVPVTMVVIGQEGQAPAPHPKRELHDEKMGMISRMFEEAQTQRHPCPDKNRDL